jgi:hypothetical protein
MSVKLKIKITRDIVLSSKHCHGTQCAFANAVRDILPNAWISSFTIYPFSEISNDTRKFDLSKEMSEFVFWFDIANQDEKEMFTEKEFELEIPDWVIDEIDIESIRPLLQNHPTLTLCETT